MTIHSERRYIVLLDWKKVCHPLYLFSAHRRVEPVEGIKAIAVVLHEKAHVNGVRIEWQAECAAIPGVLRQLRRWGYGGNQVVAVKWYLVGLNKGRASDYRLRGRCHV